MDVILIQGKAAGADFKLSQELMGKMDIRFSNESLDLSNKSTNKETLYLIVDNLQKITLGQNTSLTSADIITSNRMDLFVYDGAFARLKTTGRINAYALGESDLEITHNKLPSATAVISY